MKDKGISRNIGKGQSRSPEGGPGLGHIQRMAVGGPGSGSRGDRRRRRHQTEAGKASGERQHPGDHSLLVRWSMVFGFLALVILSLFVMFWLKPYLEERTEIGESRGKVLSVIEKEPENKIPGERETISLVKKSLAVTDPKDVEKFILLDSSSPEEVVEFLEKVKQEDGEITRYDWVARLDTTREDISGVAVTFKKEGKTRNRLALLIPDEDGRWKMDFAAFARSTTPSWSDLMEGKANSAVVRVYVAPDQYFNGPFKEQDGWRCYGIASPDMPDLFYGYCLVGSPQDKVLAALLSDGKGARATIGIERIEGTSERQFRIKRVLAEDWAIRDTPADEVVK